MRAVDPQTGRLYRVVGSAQHFQSPPKALQQATLDNLAIVPASLLPEKAEWQALANTLPAGSTLIILPSKPSVARAALEQVSRSLSAHGSRVTTIEQGARRLQWYRRETITP